MVGYHRIRRIATALTQRHRDILPVAFFFSRPPGRPRSNTQTQFTYLMKKIEAVIRRTRFEETKEALLENGVEWFSYVDVRGSGHARNRRVYRGVMYETDIIERMMLILIVRDELCDKAIDTIIRTARTGEIGDGRVWVSDIDHYYSIRTGRCDEQINNKRSPAERTETPPAGEK